MTQLAKMAESAGMSPQQFMDETIQNMSALGVLGIEMQSNSEEITQVVYGVSYGPGKDFDVEITISKVSKFANVKSEEGAVMEAEQSHE